MERLVQPLLEKHVKYRTRCDEIYIFGTYVFWAIAAIFGPIWAIPSHVWMIMDPSWGSLGRFVDFSNFELFWERLYSVVTPKTQNGQKMAKNSQK